MHSYRITLVFLNMFRLLNFFLQHLVLLALRPCQDKMHNTGVGTNRTIGQSLGRQLLADAHERNTVDLNDVVIYHDTAIHASNRVLHDSLDIDVELILHAVDHVDPDDSDTKTWWRGDSGVHEKVHLHQVHLGYLFLQLVLQPGVEELRARYLVATVVLLHGEGGPDLRGGAGELETGGWLVESLVSSDFIGDDEYIIKLVMAVDVFISVKNTCKFLLQGGEVEL